MKFEGKAVRLFAATLVATSQIATAATVEGTGYNQAEDVSQLGTLNSSALPVFTIAKDDIVTLPDGHQRTIHVEVSVVQAVGEEQESALDDLEKIKINSTIDEHGQALAINVDGGGSQPELPDDQYFKSLQISNPTKFSFKNFRLPDGLQAPLEKLNTDLKDWWTRWYTKYKVHNPENMAIPGNRTSKTLAIIRYSGVTFFPMTMAVCFGHVPIYAAIPLALAVGTMSATFQRNNALMPYNDEKMSLVNKGLWYLGTELFFNAVALSTMWVTNLTTHAFLGETFYNLHAGSSLSTTTIFATIAQGLFDLADFTLITQYMDHLRSKFGPSHETFAQREGRGKIAWNAATVGVSFVSVTLSTSMQYGWEHATASFGYFIGAAILYSAAVYSGLPRKLFVYVDEPLRIGLSQVSQFIGSKCQDTMRFLRIKK